MKPRRSLFALITFCATTAFVSALALAIVFVSATAAYALAAAFDPGVQEFSGVISDSHCAGRHLMKDKSSEECTRYCVAHGSEYVLVNGENVYTLDGNAAAFTTFSGERVTVLGELDGATIKVTSVKPIRPAPPGA